MSAQLVIPSASERHRGRRFHFDGPLLLLLLVLTGYGLVVLYSALDANVAAFTAQFWRLMLGFVALSLAAHLSPYHYLRWAPWIFGAGVLMSLAVPIFGVTVKGSTRWLDLPGLPTFQPSEIMKIAVPLMLAWYLAEKPLPPQFKHVSVCGLIILVPVALIVIEPDLGTGILVLASGLAVLLLAGIQWRWISIAMLAGLSAAPGIWFLLRGYQKERILTLFNPERDPLGAGWSIIQSKTAIGSGGIFGKGLLEGTQSHLDFLPESHTDFIIAVMGEEMGLLGVLFLLLVYAMVLMRGMYVAVNAQDRFGRLLAGSLTVTFFVYVFVNIAMVSGLLPVVGVPLPLVSYGGTSIVTLMAAFGIIMSIHTHRKLISR
ncbi:MAG: rod shape-determining protein RodA [Gammaproteobacteria bacterium]|nr:rod shape-determining protein RodA [Gammaproteobacteria bacterium]